MDRLILIAVTLTLSACSASGGLFGGRDRSSAEAPPPETTDAGGVASIDARGLAVYLEMMRLLIEGDALTQAETYRSVAEAADYAPTTTNRLKYALALAVPGHSGADPVVAEQRLSALLSAGDALLPEERVLATIQLRDVEQRLILDTAAQRLRREMEAALEEQNTASARRVQGLIDENRRLQAELDDASAKLAAITTIEQSIQEREDSAN